MKRLASLCWIFVASLPAAGQELPKPTPAGLEALAQLERTCVSEGALKQAQIPGSTSPILLVVDRAQLQKILVERRGSLSASLCDALIATGQATPAEDLKTCGKLALLQGVADTLQDDRLRGFAAMLAGRIADFHGQRVESSRQFEKALALFATTKDEAWQAHCLNKLGLTALDLGNYAAALAKIEVALKTYRRLQGERSGNAAACLNNLGAVHLAQGKFRQALEYYEQADQMEAELPELDDVRRATGLVNIATVYADLGDHDTALKRFQQAVMLFRGAPTGRSARLAIALQGLGHAYLRRGEFTAALEKNLEALEIVKEVHADADHPEVATAQHNVARVFEAKEEFAKALPLYQEALRIRLKAAAGSPLYVAATWSNLGVLHKKLGAPQRALECFHHALKIRRNVLGDRHFQVAGSLHDLSLLHLDLRDPHKALAYNSESLEALRRTPGKQPLDLDQLKASDLETNFVSLDAVQARGILLSRTFRSPPTPQEVARANRAFALAADILEEVRRTTLVSDGSKLDFLANLSEFFPMRIAALHLLHTLDPKDDHLRETFAAVEQGTARLFLEQLGTARAKVVGKVSAQVLRQEGHLLDELKALDARLAKERATELNQQDLVTLAKLESEGNRLRADLGKLRADMAVRFPDYAAWMYPLPCTLQEARKLLAPTEVAVIYVPGKSVSYALVVQPERAAGPGLSIFQLPAQGEFQGILDALVDPKVLQELPARTRELGALAYKLLVAPIADALKDHDLVIVPNGDLCFLPFQLLQEPIGRERTRFFIEGRRIRYAPSLTALHLLKRWREDPQRPRADLALWALGDPIYEADDPRAAGKGKLSKATLQALAGYSQGATTSRFKRLVHSRAEIQALAQGTAPDQTNVLLDERASENAVKEASASGQLARFRHVHFATHGILGLDAGRQPALVLNLAANDADDGFLTLEEITNLKLNADLVVLSACQTGQGRLHNSEGVRGLGRAFLYAGSRAVICSLWSVDDQETAHLMASFYGHLRKGSPPATALRAAQRDAIEAGKSAFNWAPFIVIGE